MCRHCLFGILPPVFACIACPFCILLAQTGDLYVTMRHRRSALTIFSIFTQLTPQCRSSRSGSYQQYQQTNANISKKEFQDLKKNVITCVSRFSLQKCTKEATPFDNVCICRYGAPRAKQARKLRSYAS